MVWLSRADIDNSFVFINNNAFPSYIMMDLKCHYFGYPKPVLPIKIELFS